MELGNAYFLVNSLENARTHWHESIRLGEDRLVNEGDNIGIVQVVAEAHARLGNMQQARSYIEKYMVLMTPGNALYTSHNYILAYLYELVGDREEALTYVSNLFEEGWKPIYFVRDVYLAPITQDPAFKKIAQDYNE